MWPMYAELQDGMIWRYKKIRWKFLRNTFQIATIENCTRFGSHIFETYCMRIQNLPLLKQKERSKLSKSKLFLVFGPLSRLCTLIERGILRGWGVGRDFCFVCKPCCYYRKLSTLLLTIRGITFCLPSSTHQLRSKTFSRVNPRSWIPLQIQCTWGRDSTQLLKSCVKPHKPVQSCNISRWITEILSLSLIDTTILKDILLGQHIHFKSYQS